MIVLLMEWYFLVLYISCLIYNWVLTWKDLTTPVTRWQGYFRIFPTLPRQLKEWDKQGFLMSARLFMWLYRQQCFLCLYCPQESVLRYEGIRLMQADRRRELDECIYLSICVCFVCVKGKIITLLTDFPEAFSSVINPSLSVTSKNCSCFCSFLDLFALIH